MLNVTFLELLFSLFDSIDTTLDDEKSKTLLNPGQTKINLTLEYTALKSVNMELVSQAEQPAPVSEGEWISNLFVVLSGL